MAQTFFHCSSLKALDLSKLTSSVITNTNRMLCGCESLLYINMNDLDLSNVNNATYMFYNMKEINYLEIKGIKLNDKMSIGKHKSICCDYDIELKNCKRNYIICKYKETTEYIKGFQNEYRKNIFYIKNETSIVGPNERLIIEANTTIEIYFSEPITSIVFFPQMGPMILKLQL